MKVGLQVPYFTWKGGADALGATFGAVARRAEDGGFASLWVMDHFFQIPGVGRPDEDMLEGYTALSYAAALTSGIKLGTLVTGVTYRHPGILVKTATTLDVLSGGRAYFGVGAAWFDREHAGLGVAFPPLRERFQRLEETLRIARQMWDPDANGPHEGPHYQLAETLCVPQPVSRPHPPILVGGRGERKTLRLVARYADAWNMGGGRPTDDVLADFVRLCAILKEHCAREGRNYDDIEKSVLFTLMVREDGDERWATPRQTLDMLRKFRDAGLDHAICNMPFVDDPRTLELLAEKVVAPASSW